MSLLHYLNELQVDGPVDGCLSFKLDTLGNLVHTSTQGECGAHGAPDPELSRVTHANVQEPVFLLAWEYHAPRHWSSWACRSCIDEAIEEYPHAFSNADTYLEYRRTHKPRRTKREVQPGVHVVSKYMR